MHHIFFFHNFSVSGLYLFVLFWFYFTILYWFCHTSTCICHGCTRVPHPEPPSHLLPHTIPLGHPSVPAPSNQYRALNLDWQLVSYMILHLLTFINFSFSSVGLLRNKFIYKNDYFSSQYFDLLKISCSISLAKKVQSLSRV